MMKIGKKRVISVILAITFILTVLCFGVFITVESHHECSGEKCPVCCHISFCKSAIKTTALVVSTSGAATAFYFSIFSESVFNIEDAVNSTLVTLKVKLSD